MLDSEVVQAARAGRFAVYPVARVEEAITLLLGKPAGKADEKGRYPPSRVFLALFSNGSKKMREHERQEHARTIIKIRPFTDRHHNKTDRRVQIHD